MFPKIISIEGNIGAGKSTILTKTKERVQQLYGSEVIFIEEPVDNWEKIRDPTTGENILQKFYANPDKYAFSFQVMAYASRLAMIRTAIRENPDCKVIICERSLDADKEVFAKMLYRDGKIEDIEYQIYQHFYKEYSCEFFLSGIIYIDADAVVCSERITKRLRAGEQGIPLSYLQKCKNYHDDWILDIYKSSENTTQLLHLCTNSDVTYDAADPNDKGNKWIKQIEVFINSFVGEGVEA